MKKIIYAILICIIVAGAAITCTMGLKADIIYSKNTQIDIYVGKTVDIKEIKQIVKEVFPNERSIVQEIELFEDMVAITISEKSDEELKDKLELLNTKINDKYEIENKVEDLKVTHNPKIKLSSVLKPYILPIVISIVIILIYVAVRYKKLGVFKTLVSYILCVGAIEAIFLSILAITRFPINRLVIPIGLVLYVIVITSLGFSNENKLEKLSPEVKEKK